LPHIFYGNIKQTSKASIGAKAVTAYEKVTKRQVRSWEDVLWETVTQTTNGQITESTCCTTCITRNLLTQGDFTKK